MPATNNDRRLKTTNAVASVVARLGARVGFVDPDFFDIIALVLLQDLADRLMDL
jgi:hypothetical protein